MVSMIEQIRVNDSSVKELCLVENPGHYFSHISEIVNALESNTVIDTVRLESDFLPRLSAVHQSELLTAIGKLASLKKVYFDGVPMSVKLLASLLQQAGGLNVLDVHHADLEGSPEDFRDFDVALSKHLSLQTFVLKDFVVVESDQFCFDRIVQALGHIITLEHVELEARKAGHAYFSGLALTGLVIRSEILQQLHISHFQLDQLGVNRVAQAVKSIPTLKNLSLNHAGLNDLGAAKLASALKHREAGTLDAIDVSFNEVGDKGCVALADGIKSNKSVRAVRVRGNKQIGTAGFAAMSAVHSQTRSLELLDISQHRARHHDKRVAKAA